MPVLPSIAACSLSSVHRELPPSTTTSPLPRSPRSSSMVPRVMSPAGTITQTTRGSGSFSTMSASEVESLMSWFRS